MAAPHSASLKQRKRDLRITAAARRAGCDPDGAGERLAVHVLRWGGIPPDIAVSAYWPMGDEMDVRPLLAALARRNTLLLPVTPKLGSPLTFRIWTPGDTLVPGRFGTSVPPPAAPEGIPKILLVPLLAFDAAGRRLGYGGGYYDRTLAALPDAVPIGCAYAGQQLDAVPVDAYDRQMRAIATERGVIVCQPD